MQRIKIAALGWTEDALTLGAMRALKSASRVLLRTGKIGAADWLRAEGVAFETLDALYEDCEDFDELNRKIADAVKAAEGAVYGVPDLRDETVRLLLRECEAECLPGVGTGCEFGRGGLGKFFAQRARWLSGAGTGLPATGQRSQASVDGGIPSERFRGVCRAGRRDGAH